MYFSFWIWENLHLYTVIPVIPPLHQQVVQLQLTQFDKDKEKQMWEDNREKTAVAMVPIHKVDLKHKYDSFHTKQQENWRNSENIYSQFLWVFVVHLVLMRQKNKECKHLKSCSRNLIPAGLSVKHQQFVGTHPVRVLQWKLKGNNTVSKAEFDWWCEQRWAEPDLWPNTCWRPRWARRGSCRASTGSRPLHTWWWWCSVPLCPVHRTPCKSRPGCPGCWPSWVFPPGPGSTRTGS